MNMTVTSRGCASNSRINCQAPGPVQGPGQGPIHGPDQCPNFELKIQSQILKRKDLE